MLPSSLASRLLVGEGEGVDVEGIEVLLARAGDATGRAAALAGQVRDVAEAARALAVRVQATEGTAWRSVAAELFRDRIDDLVIALRRGADAVEDAGDAVSAHAATAAARAEHLAGLARALDRALQGGADDAERWARRALEDALPRRAPWW